MKARGVVAEQRRRFAVGGEHAAAAVVAQDEIADRAGERRVAFGTADGGAPAIASGARAADQMQRRIGRGRRGDGGEPQTAERRRIGAESPAAQQRAQKQQRDREQLAKRSSEANGGPDAAPLRARSQHQPARGSISGESARARRRTHAAVQQRQREQRNELRLDSRSAEVQRRSQMDDRRRAAAAARRGAPKSATAESAPTAAR